jgi:hypothetical protein
MSPAFISSRQQKRLPLPGKEMEKNRKSLSQKGGIIKMKRLIVLVSLATLMCFGFVGCKKEGGTPPTETTAITPAEEAANATVPAAEEAAPVEEEGAPSH